MHAYQTTDNSYNVELANLQTDIKALTELHRYWQNDYVKKGGFATNSIRLPYLLKTQKYTAIKATIGQEIIAFGLIRKDLEHTQIHVVYVKKQHRSNGVATALYKYALEELGANQIELTYKRVLNNLTLWQSLGFKSLNAKLNGGYSANGLCLVSTQSHIYSILAVPLQRDAIKKYMKMFSQANAANENAKPMRSK